MNSLASTWTLLLTLTGMAAGLYKFKKELDSLDKLSRKYFLLTFGPNFGPRTPQTAFKCLVAEFVAENGELYLFFFDLTRGSIQNEIEHIFLQVWEQMGFIRRMRWRYYKLIKRKFSFFQIRSFVEQHPSQLIFKFEIEFNSFSLATPSYTDVKYTPIPCKKNDVLSVHREASSIYTELREEYAKKTSFPHPIYKSPILTKIIRKRLFNNVAPPLQNQLWSHICKSWKFFK